MLTKMYILVKEKLSAGQAALACAHGALSGYLTFVEAELAELDERDRFVAFGCKTQTQIWAAESFRKVVCSVTDDKFEEAKTFGIPGRDYRVMTESGLDGIEVAVVFRPREFWEPFFKGLPLWGKGKTLVDSVAV